VTIPTEEKDRGEAGTGPSFPNILKRDQLHGVAHASKDPWTPNKIYY